MIAALMYPDSDAEYPKRSKRDTEDPCVKCGWAKHMGIHQMRRDSHGSIKRPACEYERSYSQEKEK